jgi:uncharacterized integral membrane protein
VTDPQPQPPPPAVTGGKKPLGAASKARLIVIGIIALFLIVFVALNTHDTKVDFVFGSTKVSVIFVILLSLALGFVLGLFFTPLRRRRQGKQS